MSLPSPFLASDDSLPLVRVRAESCGEVVDTHTLRWPVAAHDAPRKPSYGRRAQPADFLLPVANRWLASLPPSVRPRTLAQAFPRLANRLAAAWDDDPGLSLVFADLLIDQRGGRQGFPPRVKADLYRLWRHWHDLRDGAADVAA